MVEIALSEIALPMNEPFGPAREYALGPRPARAERSSAREPALARGQPPVTSTASSTASTSSRGQTLDLRLGVVDGGRHEREPGARDGLEAPA